MQKQFSKNDNGFICTVCGHSVKPLKTSSRDHCTECLCSLHVDIFPGDRANDCLGVLVPQELLHSSNKGYVIKYKCSKCGKFHNNKTADDDNYSTILSVSNGTYNVNLYKKTPN